MSWYLKDRKLLIMNETIIIPATLLFLIKNMFTGHLNNLHSCVANRQKQTVCVIVETRVCTCQMRPILCRHTRQNLFGPSFF